MYRLVPLVLVLLVGCGQIAPMDTPPQLSATPGPPVVITADRYTTTAFSVWHPAGWRAVTSASFAEPSVVFISPDETAVIAVAVDGDDIAAVEPPVGVGVVGRDVIHDGLTVRFRAADERYLTTLVRLLNNLMLIPQT
jgi:hypothetical protein